MKKLLPIILLVLGASAGIGAGFFLRPPPKVEKSMIEACAADDAACLQSENGTHDALAGNGHDDAATSHETAASDDHGEEAAGSGPEYVALQRQMIVPIVSNDQVISLVVLSLSIEVQPGFSNDVYDREPKLRDAFLQVLFRHANSGGFGGDFTSGEKMSDLRSALNGAAQQVLGPVAIQVLVTDILRQET